VDDRPARAAGLRSPSERPGISLRAKAAALAALAGGKTATQARGIEVVGALVDATAAYPLAGALLGTTSWLQAETLDVRRLLAEPEVWSSLAGLALVEPDDDVLAVRGRVLGAVEDHTGTVPIAPDSEPIWCGVPRVLASKLRTGRMPKLLEAYTFQPEGIVEGARAVALPGGIVFHPRLDRIRRGRRFRDLPLALAEVGLRAKAGTLEAFDRPAMNRLQGAVKVARNVAAYGGPVEFNPSLRAHSAWGPDGKLARPVHEEPGWFTDPVAGSLVVCV
jgi:hypothetical protein